MQFWYPIGAHPGAPSRRAWFVADAMSVYPAVGHPDGASGRAWFRLEEGLVAPTPENPRAIDAPGSAGGPWYEIIGSFVYPAAGHPDGPSAAPWYQVR